jgi:hypothetical protein
MGIIVAIIIGKYTAHLTVQSKEEERKPQIKQKVDKISP